jgi:hypothetical protein
MAKNKLEVAKKLKVEKQPKTEKTQKEQLNPKLKSILVALNSDPVLFDQVSALIRIQKKNKK